MIIGRGFTSPPTRGKQAEIGVQHPAIDQEQLWKGQPKQSQDRGRR